MKENTSDRLKNFLVNGIGTSARQDIPAEAVPVSETDPSEESTPYSWSPEDDIVPLPPRVSDSDMEEIKGMLHELLSREQAPAPDMSAYLTTREQSKAINATVSKLESSASNKVLVAALSQICTMREDFFRLCRGMEEKIDELDARTVLSSFQAYEVDMENILMDSGVFIGHFDFPKLNTLHQRIVGVVPTGDKEKDGTVAARISDGYKLADRVLLKEKVDVYKFDPSMVVEAEETPEGMDDTEEEPVQEESCDEPSVEETEAASEDETTESPEEESVEETVSETSEQTAEGEAGDGMEEKE